jgi:triose/dihydroxyacetone kinase / FAD-AMP lyase (cyclizing)
MFVVDVELLTKATTTACNSLIAAESLITYQDSIVGDGDCGTTLARGAKGVLEWLSSASLSNETSASEAILGIAHTIEETMDGTSGALYELFFNALATALRAPTPPQSTTNTITPQIWIQTTTLALKTLMQATPARIGDRTMMDALIPFVETLSEEGDTKKALRAAKDGRDSTKGMPASLGRAVYVAGQNLSEVPDPGAEGVVAILEGLLGVK